MGTVARPKPKRLAEKLKQIRLNLSLTQVEMVEKLMPDVTGITQSSLTNIERGKREPNLLLLLQYARLAKIIIDVLVDDEQHLPSLKP